MPHFRFLISACLGTFAYVVISILGGQDGLWAYRQLEEQKQIISINTAEIAAINENLQQEYIGLQEDPSIIAAYARKLGYVSENETLVKISGLKPLYEPLYEMGTVSKREAILFIPEWICKCFGVVISGLSFILLFLLEKSMRRHSYSAVVQPVKIEPEPYSGTAPSPLR